MLGVMIDCSRNAVMKPKAVKQFADIVKAMCYDTLMIYTEDTYEVNGQPLFGCMCGKYTKKEIREIDAYCSEKWYGVTYREDAASVKNAMAEFVNKGMYKFYGGHYERNQNN